MILSIKYNKKSGEYTIRTCEITTGKRFTITANKLTRDEKMFAKNAVKIYEDTNTIVWC